MRVVVPLGRVLLLADALTGRQIGDLDGLLVRHQMLIILVGDRHTLHLIRQVARQTRLRGQLVLDLLAREHDLAIHALLLATLR